MGACASLTGSSAILPGFTSGEAPSPDSDGGAAGAAGGGARIHAARASAVRGRSERPLPARRGLEHEPDGVGPLPAGPDPERLQRARPHDKGKPVARAVVPR